ncbi:hypothetical protein [Bradyrhizobium niftali]|uniref:Cytochrome c domain-containing protein n=1 Tax=Bradyrhizobium niftali TaxID=2560055 RepID=A0A4Y9L7V5_9BRAD|nr:hypothetical protein [Bradyrhizobium niftali]TFV37852.1 hypothetical protein E4K65_43115 [Bradyrhizobium niftali]
MRRLTITVITLLASSQIAAAQVTLNREDAFNAPSRHAWNLFLTVNHPAKDPTQGRGLPDLQKKFGAPNTTVVWETWRLARNEVFVPPGQEPLPWDDLSLSGNTVGKVPEPPKNVLIARALALSVAPELGGLTPSPLIDDDGIFQKTGQFGETRVNRATYEFITGQDPRFAINKSYKLWTVDGQRRYAKDWIDQKVVDGKKLSAISFPVEAMEVKAAWIDLERVDMVGKETRFYIADYKGKKYGLVALHIITKDIPNWFWATFHFKEQLKIKDGVVVDLTKAEEITDDYGPPTQIKGTVWENYKLGGAQTDFITPMGKPTFLSDAYIEKGIEHSSCISCHSRASITADPAIPGPSSDATANGAPKPEWFIRDGKPFAMQLDFLFSMAFRAQ